MCDGNIEILAKKLREGDVVAFSGAGLSTESGLQDFRSQNGIWKKYDPTRMASHEVLTERYDDFIEFYREALWVPEEIKPNFGHKFIAELEAQGLVLGVITQNIDGLHEKAGSKTIAALHGSNEPIICCNCGEIATPEAFFAHKHCVCGGNLRPSVVLFGEELPVLALNLANRLVSKAKTLLVLGSSLTVSPANYFPMAAKEAGANLIIINRDPTPLDRCADLVIHDTIGSMLQEVAALID